MLFAYPSAAAADNWLHECVQAVLQSIHDSVEAGDDCPGWPNFVPTEYRARVRARRGLRDRFAAYRSALLTLGPERRALVVRAMEDQNRLEDLLCQRCDCSALLDLPEAIRESVSDLFEFCFDLLTHLGIRDGQYRAIHQAITHKVCPFCGCEYFNAPRSKREALDHYLVESKYPFAGANLKNLAPMGHKCNSLYKGAKDILRTEAGQRRSAFYPYGNIGTRAVSLIGSTPIDTPSGALGFDWQISIDRPCEEVDTWDSVFELRSRLRDDVLEVCFRDWIGEFSAFVASAGLPVESDEQISAALQRCASFNEIVFIDRAFLKSAFFSMLLQHFNDGNQRIIHLVRDAARANGMAA